MNDKLKTAMIKYGITAVIAGLMAWLALDLRAFSLMTDPAEKYRALADAFTIPGMTLIMVWLLVLVSAEGIFDGIGYALTHTITTLIPGLGGKKTEAYADYLERKAVNRAGKKSSVFLLHVGLAFMAVSIVFIVLFYTV